MTAGTKNDDSARINIWTQDPKVLFDPRYITEIWPQARMTYAQKINATARLILIVSVGMGAYTGQPNPLFIGAITLACVMVLYNIHVTKRGRAAAQEGLANRDDEGAEGGDGANGANGGIQSSKEELAQILKTEFHPVQPHNPYGNLLVTDVANDPQRRSAPPAFNPDVRADILAASEAGLPDAGMARAETKTHFGDVANQHILDSASLQFYSMPCTQTVNDQGAFAQFLYGSMGSCKDQLYNCNYSANNGVPGGI